MPHGSLLLCWVAAYIYKHIFHNNSTAGHHGRCAERVQCKLCVTILRIALCTTGRAQAASGLDAERTSRCQLAHLKRSCFDVHMGTQQDT